VRFFGEIGSDNAGMSNDKPFENKGRRKLKVSDSHVRRHRS